MVAGRIVAPHIRAWRKRFGLSQAEFAARAGITRPTVSKVENGLPVVGATIRRIATAFYLKPEDLLAPPK